MVNGSFWRGERRTEEVADKRTDLPFCLLCSGITSPGPAHGEGPLKQLPQVLGWWKLGWVHVCPMCLLSLKAITLGILCPPQPSISPSCNLWGSSPISAGWGEGSKEEACRRLFQLRASLARWASPPPSWGGRREGVDAQRGGSTPSWI